MYTSSFNSQPDSGISTKTGESVCLCRFLRLFACSPAVHFRPASGHSSLSNLAVSFSFSDEDDNGNGRVRHKRRAKASRSFSTVSSFKLLGVMLRSDLSWCDQVYYVIKKQF